MTKLEEYQNKKAQLTTELENINREMILTEQTIKQQEEIFKQQFQTTDAEKLKAISESYQKSIEEAEKELQELEALDETEVA